MTKYKMPECVIHGSSAPFRKKARIRKDYSPEQLRGWNFHSIKPPCANENRYYYRPRPSRTDFCCLRFEYLSALYSDAATAAGTGWRLRSEERRVGKECRSRW